MPVEVEGKDEDVDGKDHVETEDSPDAWLSDEPMLALTGRTSSAESLTDCETVVNTTPSHNWI